MGGYDEPNHMEPRQRASAAVLWRDMSDDALVGRVEMAIRAAEDAAIEGCAIAARAWLSIPENENAESLPDTLRRLKRSERVE